MRAIFTLIGMGLLLGWSGAGVGMDTLPEGFYAASALTDSFPLVAVKRANGQQKVYYVYRYRCVFGGSTNFSSASLDTGSTLELLISPASSNRFEECSIGIELSSIDSTHLRGSNLDVSTKNPTGRNFMYQKISQADFIQKFRSFGFQYATGAGNVSDDQQAFCQDLFSQNCQTFLNGLK